MWKMFYSEIWSLKAHGSIHMNQSISMLYVKEVLVRDLVLKIHGCCLYQTMQECDICEKSFDQKLNLENT